LPSCAPVATRRPAGRRLRALVIVLWRSGLLISEALALEERDLDPTKGTITAAAKAASAASSAWTLGRGRRSSRGRRSGARAGGAGLLRDHRAHHRTSPLRIFGARQPAGARRTRRRPASNRAAPIPSLPRNELVREGVPVHILQRQLGHANLAVTTV
jgi:integrase